jgi:hypothetical protein
MAQIRGETHMKRLGNLWDELTSFENLLGAARLAAQGKRQRTDVASFALDLEGELLPLRRELIEEEYRPGAYRSFQITIRSRARFRRRPSAIVWCTTP